jgi:hypothetical protein
MSTPYHIANAVRPQTETTSPWREVGTSEQYNWTMRQARTCVQCSSLRRRQAMLQYVHQYAVRDRDDTFHPHPLGGRLDGRSQVSCVTTSDSHIVKYERSTVKGSPVGSLCQTTLGKNCAISVVSEV